MIIVYLDQNHLSNLAKHACGSKVDRRLAPLAEVLRTSMDVVCPFSLAHVLETIACGNREIREMIAATVAHVSRGKSYRNDASLRRIEIAGLQVGRPASPVALTTDPLDVFPDGVLGPLTRGALDLRGQPNAFGTLVETMAADSNMPQMIDASKHEAKEYAEHIQERRVAAETALPSAQRVERSAIVRLLAEESGLSVADVERLLAAADADATGRLLFAAEYAARHSMKLTRTPTITDALDAAHATYAPYSQVFVTDRYVADVARTPLDRLGCFCTPDPAAAADFLRRHLDMERGDRAAPT